jgi:methyl-accepting chemotaxis protein
MRLSLRFKIMSLAAAGLISAGVIGAAGIIGQQKMNDINHEKEILSQALQNHVDGDMMHDAIRADVFGANLHAMKHNPDAIKSSVESMREHAGRFRKNVEHNSVLPLSTDIKKLLSEIQPSLESYIASGEEIIRLFGQDLGAGESRLLDFQKAFGILEASQGVLTEKLEAELARKSDAVERVAKDVENFQLGVLAAFSLGLFIFAFWILRSIMRDLGGEPDHAADVVRRIATGDLSVTVITQSHDQTSLLFNIKTMAERLSEIISEVRSSADTLLVSSHEMNSTAQSLAQGASQQAVSVEETSASMEEMSASITQNNQNAGVTDEIAQKSANDAAHGGEAVCATVEAMQKIAERIGVIDEIAYQTNLLALNAAIEAGRAGTQGRGFAVVASEVRKLAERSQFAAQEIGELATASVKRAEMAGNLLEAMVPSIRKTADLVQEIAAASAEQATGVIQINGAMGQVSQTMQQNAAASEQLSSAAEELTAQAEKLQQVMTYFTLAKAGKSVYDANSGSHSRGSSTFVKSTFNKMDLVMGGSN